MDCSLRKAAAARTRTPSCSLSKAATSTGTASSPHRARPSAAAWRTSPAGSVSRSAKAGSDSRHRLRRPGVEMAQAQRGHGPLPLIRRREGRRQDRHGLRAAHRGQPPQPPPAPVRVRIPGQGEQIRLVIRPQGGDHRLGSRVIIQRNRLAQLKNGRKLVGHGHCLAGWNKWIDTPNHTDGHDQRQITIPLRLLAH